MFIIVLCVPHLISSVHEMDCLGKETVSVSPNMPIVPENKPLFVLFVHCIFVMYLCSYFFITNIK